MNINNYFNRLGVTETLSFLPLNIKNLCFKINEKIILNNVNLSLLDTSFTVIMGPNGSGKTVLLKIINGLLNKTSGEILWNGKKLNYYIRNLQSFVFQKPIILRRTVKENIDFIIKLKNKKSNLKSIEYLELVGLEKLINSPARKLSLGEQQRLSLVRALATGPSFLLLDEPTANLDPSSTFVIEKLILAAKDFGIKIIFVTHDIFQAKRLADEVVFIDKGNITEFSKANLFFKEPSSLVAKKYLSGELID